VGVRPYVGTQQTYYNHDLQDLDEVRGTFFTGLILNTKLYKSWDYENKAWDIHGLRVVHEPIIEYRLQDEPTVSKDRLEQFDRIDALREENYVQFRIENRRQITKINIRGFVRHLWFIFNSIKKLIRLFFSQKTQIRTWH
jgi:hypothetical protein